MNKLTLFLRIILIPCFTCVFSYGYTQYDSTVVKPLNIGEIRTIYSSILKEKRTINIYLPADLDSSKAYPVLYLLDGSIDEDFLHITGLTQFINLMYEMPSTIIVGIANVDRKRDFTFHTDKPDLKKDYPTTGHSEKFIGFIEKELKPYIEKIYKTNDTSFLIGQSLGGLLATEILLKKSTLFSHYFIVSPSLWWDNGSLLKKAADMLSKQNLSDKNIYISAGLLEEKQMQDDAKKLYTLLKKKNIKKIRFRLMPDENHATILHRSIYEALIGLYKERY